MPALPIDPAAEGKSAPAEAERRETSRVARAVRDRELEEIAAEIAARIRRVYPDLPRARGTPRRLHGRSASITVLCMTRGIRGLRVEH
jgi:hypothetical protein